MSALSPPLKNKRVFSSVLLFCISVFLSLAIAELGLRQFYPQPTGPSFYRPDPQLERVNTPDAHGRRTIPNVYSYTFTTNSNGFRGSKNYSYQKTSAYRVLFLGDSFTYGMGVNDDETFPSLIEKRLKAAGKDAEVINGAVPGTGPDYALRFFQISGHKFNSDLVVLAFSCTDFADCGWNSYFKVDTKENLRVKSVMENPSRDTLMNVRWDFISKMPFYDWFMSHSHLAGLIKFSLLRLLLNSPENFSPMEHSGAENSWDAGDYNKAYARIYLKHLANEVQNAHASFLLFYVPCDRDVIDYRSAGTTSPNETAFNEIARTLEGIRFWSSTPVLSNSKLDIDQLFFAGEHHYTAAAHALAADFMADQIEEADETLQKS